jgi:putative tricarboxylic transport membrane protein
MLAALILHGIQPGPFLLAKHSQLVYTLFAGLLIVNVLMIPVGLVILRLCLFALRLATPVLVATVLALCVIGTYAAELDVVNPWIALAFGVLGCGMRAYGFSPAAMVLGMVLGVMAESELRRSLIISHGSWSIFMTRPIAATLLILTVAVLVYPLALAALRRRRVGRASAGPATA